jgi:hypothetical protein
MKKGDLLKAECVTRVTRQRQNQWALTYYHLLQSTANQNAKLIPYHRWDSNLWSSGCKRTSLTPRPSPTPNHYNIMTQVHAWQQAVQSAQSFDARVLHTVSMSEGLPGSGHTASPSLTDLSSAKPLVTLTQNSLSCFTGKVSCKYSRHLAQAWIGNTTEGKEPRRSRHIPAGVWLWTCVDRSKSWKLVPWLEEKLASWSKDLLGFCAEAVLVNKDLLGFRAEAVLVSWTVWVLSNAPFWLAVADEIFTLWREAVLVSWTVWVLSNSPFGVAFSDEMLTLWRWVASIYSWIGVWFSSVSAESGTVKNAWVGLDRWTAPLLTFETNGISIIIIIAIITEEIVTMAGHIVMAIKTTTFSQSQFNAHYFVHIAWGRFRFSTTVISLLNKMRLVQTL